MTKYTYKVTGESLGKRAVLKIISDSQLSLKEIPGYEGTHYRAGSDGFIYSNAKNKLTKQGETIWYRLIGASSNKGYWAVKLCASGTGKSINVHKLVAKAFHGLPTIENPVVRHMDGVAKNNKPSNLKWGTSKENYADAVRHGTRVIPYGELAPNSKLSNEERIQICELAQLGYPQGMLGKLYGVHRITIHGVINVWWRREMTNKQERRCANQTEATE